MVRVMASGVFDILHLGHVFYLNEAKKLGDELVVVVARDRTATKMKRKPIVPEHLRLEMVRSLKPVDDAVLGSTDDYYKIVEKIKPDIIALGYDQVHDEENIKKEIKNRGINAKVMRLGCLNHEFMATRRIIERVMDTYGKMGK
ncbi:MAG: adenylyltransferase/cytidyltransferase family protein [Candidatus Thermoplasmatota archaeon]